MLRPPGRGRPVRAIGPAVFHIKLRTLSICDYLFFPSLGSRSYPPDSKEGEVSAAADSCKADKRVSNPLWVLPECCCLQPHFS